MGEALSSVVIETGPEPTACVVWLHGLGADGHDFEPLVPYLSLPDDLQVRFVFPHAPRRPVTVNQGMVMPAWYDILGLDIDRDTDVEGIESSVTLVTELLEAEQERGIPSERIVLAGFSQGGAIAAFLGLRYPSPLAGILILSAYLPLPDRLPDEASIPNRATPILMCHGDWDPVVPVNLGESTANLLRTRGYGIEWHTYPAPHSVHPEEVTRIGLWLTRVLTESGNR